MTFRTAVALGLVALVTGCTPPPIGTEFEDERNSHFKRASDAVRASDYYGAIEAYERALKENPKVVRAHFEMGMIYGDRLGDHVASIYHFQKFLSARPNAPQAQHVQTLIEKAKIDFLLTLPNSGLVNAEEIARISRENVELKQQLARAEAALAKAGASPASPALPPPPLAPLATSTIPPPAPEPVEEMAPPLAEVAAVEDVQPVPATASVGGPRIHTVRSGETLWRIASKHYPGDVRGGIQRILDANPILAGDSKNLRPGQELTLP
ncbi:MAG: LysM peptidoglycan-binding domain-containing protein [Verrucomicrobiia bacterium]